MVPETNKALIRAYSEEVINQHNLEALDQYIRDESFKQRIRTFIAAFPDVQITIDQIIAEDDKVALTFRGSGTHQGPFFGAPATGKGFTTTGNAMYRIADDKIDQAWVTWNLLEIMQQIGVVLKS